MDPAKFSEIEIGVLKLLAIGHSVKQVAFVRNRSVRTIGVHVTNMLKKAGCHSIRELVFFAIRSGVITLEELENAQHSGT